MNKDHRTLTDELDRYVFALAAFITLLVIFYA